MYMCLSLFQFSLSLFVLHLLFCSLFAELTPNTKSMFTSHARRVRTPPSGRRLSAWAEPADERTRYGTKPRPHPVVESSHFSVASDLDSKDIVLNFERLKDLLLTFGQYPDRYRCEFSFNNSYVSKKDCRVSILSLSLTLLVLHFFFASECTSGDSCFPRPGKILLLTAFSLEEFIRLFLISLLDFRSLPSVSNFVCKSWDIVMF